MEPLTPPSAASFPGPSDLPSAARRVPALMDDALLFRLVFVFTTKAECGVLWGEAADVDPNGVYTREGPGSDLHINNTSVCRAAVNRKSECLHC